MKLLLTNDDGIQATGLNVMRRALQELPGVELAVIAPDSNRSATARSITTRKPLWVEEVEFGDGAKGHATDGTPVDCVRFAALGLVEFVPELIVSGINHGSNLGDDITYSGTVAAALEGIVLGIPAIAVSQQAEPGVVDFRAGREWGAEDFEEAAAFVARMVDQLELAEERDGRRRYQIYGDTPGYEQEDGTDFAAIADGHIAVSPLHFDLTDQAGVDDLAGFDLDGLMRPAAREV